jgi:hypothetical protein
MGKLGAGKGTPFPKPLPGTQHDKLEEGYVTLEEELEQNHVIIEEALNDIDRLIAIFAARGPEELRALEEAWLHSQALYFAALAKIVEEAQGFPLGTEP